MTEEEIAKAIGLGENDDYEFKDNRRGVGESILTTVSAFANSLGGVIICCVVSKDDEATHEVVGLANAKKHKDDLWNTLNNKQSISYPSVSSGDIWVMCGRRPRVKGFFGFQLAVGCKSCVRPVCAAHMAAGPDVIRRSGPNQGRALDSA
jgi:hypothetical protein